MKNCNNCFYQYLGWSSYTCAQCTDYDRHKSNLEPVIRNIPFYDGDAVRDIVGGTLRGRGSRRFKNPIAPFGYRYTNAALDQSLPKHLAERFTLYTQHHDGPNKLYLDFVGLEPDGRVRVRYSLDNQEA